MSERRIWESLGLQRWTDGSPVPVPVPTDRFDQGHRERPSRGAGGDHSWAGSCYAGGIEDLSPGAPGGDGLGLTVSLGQVERDIRVLGHCAGPGTSRRSPRLYFRLIPATPDVRRGPRARIQNTTAANPVPPANGCARLLACSAEHASREVILGTPSSDLPCNHPNTPAVPAKQGEIQQATRPSKAASAVLVVGFDRRPESLAALMTAAELGRRLAAELRVIHAIDLTDYPVDPDRGDWEDKGQQVLQTEQETVAHQLANYEYGWSYVALHGEPVRELSRAADESDALMIVVGSRGVGWHRLYDRITSPSVSHRLIQRCGRPVLVVGAPWN